MQRSLTRCKYAFVFIVFAMLFSTVDAGAQFQGPVSGPPPGETYILEGAFGLWLPSANISIASGGTGALTGIPGTLIDFKKDLGLQDQGFPELHFELRPLKQHKFRLQFIPVSYEQTATLPRDVIFNGQRYRAGTPVNSTLDWKAYRFGYEYDFIVKDRGFAGFIVDFKYTDVNVTATNAVLNEFAEAHAPIPAIGGVGRVYVVPNVSITGEVTGFKLPSGLFEDSTGHYIDVDIYGTVNFSRNVGVQVGFRLFDVGYVVKSDIGNLTLKGIFFGLVARY
jgi:hypothetical protein